MKFTNEEKRIVLRRHAGYKERLTPERRRHVLRYMFHGELDPNLRVFVEVITRDPSLPLDEYVWNVMPADIVGSREAVERHMDDYR